ncbi:alpha-N-acetylglucosaminidase [Amycolatopsis bartoniae]|uniref:Alpha-N-acetylglucosaminidase n=1 Tax=Amycolatopsis bartoniae TaxID=941986 RepID=A0A8H9IQ56_9PSEU|nr:alpha-N-acetylglucosaminidase [Amycolatopsis bartoniae]MBB2939994.1 alpha-N-acetylglucosaminidase [Amycolatopsis bartoniae]TVT09961.1 alpha-N-acetylglucosaminidase [Amycolatopsis bartoniae]GHF32147.1 alpha-N-acetylglucosaminidase [Amycolatopsis bartoniae]
MTGSKPADAAIRRLSGLPASAVRVRLAPEVDDGFRVRSAGGVLTVTASGAGAAVAGYAAYARRTGVAHVSRLGTRPVDRDLPDGAEVSGNAAIGRRIAYNLTVGGYTTPYYDWAQWEHEIDLLAAAGVTAAHLTVGQELVYLETFLRCGYEEEELLRWLGPPSHQPWLWLNNIQSFGRGTTRTLVHDRAALARRVIERMRALDIVPVLPGFSGTVPPGFTAHWAGARTVPQGRWFKDVVGPVRPDWLDSTTDAYAAVAAMFYAEQRAAFGATGMWAVDLVHEGGHTGGTDLGAAARGVRRAMTAADPGATWVMQAWGGNPRRELLEAVGTDRVLVIDLTGEDHREDGFGGPDWVLGILPNYGGRTTLYGDLADVAALPRRWRDRTRPPGLVGLADMAEGVANNPVLWDLFHDLTWATEPVDLGAWVREWTTSRYGAADARADEAWRVLLRTAYGPWRHDKSGRLPAETAQALAGLPVDAADVRGVPAFSAMIDQLADAMSEVASPYASTDSVIAAVPSLDANQASLVGPRAAAYPDGALIPALRALLDAAERLDTPGLSYDLVDLARQVADDVARTALRQIEAAARACDLQAYDTAVRRLLDLIDAQDAVLGTNEHFLLGRWLADARAWGGTEDERGYLVMEAKRILTSWGYEDSTVLAEYANRSWAGLVGDYYRSRWARWLSEVRATLVGEPTNPVDWYVHADRWNRADTIHPHRPQGDVRAAASVVLDLAVRILRAA